MAKDRRATDPKQLRHASVLMLPNSQSAFATQPQSGFKESSRHDIWYPSQDSPSQKQTLIQQKWHVPVINGISRVNPLITGVITHLLSMMSHQEQKKCLDTDVEMIQPDRSSQKHHVGGSSCNLMPPVKCWFSFTKASSIHLPLANSYWSSQPTH